MNKKDIYSHIFTNTYNVRGYMLLTKHVLVRIRDYNDELILLQYVLTVYDRYII